MSRVVAYRHADWLSLVEPTGSFVTLPVLNRVFPSGLDRVDAPARQEVRLRLPSDFADRSQRTAWIEWALKDLLKWGSRCRSGPAVPSLLNHVVAEHGAVLRPDHVLVEPVGDRERVRALVCEWPTGTAFDAKVPGDRWAATPTERMSRLCRATGVGVGILTDGDQWRLVWAPVDGVPGGATFVSSLFSEEPAILDAFVSLLSAKRFFSVAPSDTIEALLRESAAAQEVVADQLGKQVRAAAEMLIASISRANRERDGALLQDVDPSEIYAGAVTVLMRMIFLFYAEERGLLPLDDELYARSYAASTLRVQLQEERDLSGDDPLERRSAAWSRFLALFRAVHGGLSHDALRIMPYGGRLFDPDRYPFLEGRVGGGSWRSDRASPISVDDLTMLEVLSRLQILDGRQLSYRTLEVEQIGHVYEGLLDHSVYLVTGVHVGLVGRDGEEPEVRLEELESAAAGSREDLIATLHILTGKTEKQLTRLLDAPPGDTDRQLVSAAVENDDALTERLLPFVHLLRRDLRDLPLAILPGSVIVTQTSTRREGGIEYTTKDLADEVAIYALEPVVYSPGPQDGADPADWKLRPSRELLDLKVCDPAVGSGSILVAAGRYLADRLIEAWDAEGAVEAEGPAEDVQIAARRAVADRCLYGCDRDPLAAEMAKMSLWLMTMAKDRPFTFLDHAIRVGDSLLGVTNLEQIRWMHLDPAAGKKLHRTLFDYTAALEPLVADALERRRRLSQIRVMEVRDAEDKARLTAEADADLEMLRLIGDVVIGAALSTATMRAADFNARLIGASHRVAGLLTPDLEPAQRATLVADLRKEAEQWLNSGRPEIVPVRRCLHWPIEFPEVFLDVSDPGFDCFVGNPPYIGNKYWKSRLGVEFQGFFRLVIGETIGKPDLIVPFLWRLTEVANDHATIGSLATQSISEVDSKSLMQRCVLTRAVIFRALRNRSWPGNASVNIAQIWFSRAEWGGTYVLDGLEVSGIGADLRPAAEWPTPVGLASSLYAFEGVHNARGAAMILPRDHFLCGSNDGGFVRPYLSGDEITQSDPRAPQRYVIDLSGVSKEQLHELPKDLKSYLDEVVRPTRTQGQLVSYRGLVTRWWTFWNTRERGFAVARQFEHCIVASGIAKYVIPVMMPSAWVYTNSIVVFPLQREDLQTLLMSQPFEQWARFHGGTMGERRRLKIGPVVGTFPVPSKLADPTAAERWQRCLFAAIGSEMPSPLSVMNGAFDPSSAEGLPEEIRATYQVVNDSVMAAYEWTDLITPLELRTVEGVSRFVYPVAVEAEMLRRLHFLNRERYEAEVAAGLHGAGPKKPARRRRTSDGDTPTLFGSAADPAKVGQ